MITQQPILSVNDIKNNIYYYKQRKKTLKHIQGKKFKTSAGLKTTAGQKTISGQNLHSSGQMHISLIILTGHVEWLHVLWSDVARHDHWLLSSNYFQPWSKFTAYIENHSKLMKIMLKTNKTIRHTIFHNSVNRDSVSNSFPTQNSHVLEGQGSLSMSVLHLGY